MIDNSQLTNFCKDNNTKKNNVIWLMRETLAKKWSGNIWGAGYIFQSENEQIEKAFKKFAKNNNLLNLLGYVERYCSMYGRAILTINKTKGGEFYLNLPNPFYFNGTGKVFMSPQLAIVYQRFTIDTIMYVVKSTYTPKYVENQVFTSSESRETIRVFDKEVEILEKLQMKRYWEHNLGFVPIVEITNLPFFQFHYNNNEFIKITDWYTAQMFEDLAYTALRNLNKELILSHSRVFIENADERTVQEFKDRTIDEYDEDISDFIIETATQAKTNIQAGQGDFTKYTQALDHIFDFYFKFSGSSRFSEGGGAQKTVAETSTIRSALIESTRQKIALRQAQLSELFAKIFAAMGLINFDNYEEEFIFTINGNILKDENQYIDALIKKLEIGAIDIVDVIQEIQNVPRKDAMEKFLSTREFNKKYDLEYNADKIATDNKGSEDLAKKGEA